MPQPKTWTHSQVHLFASAYPDFELDDILETIS